MVALAACMSGCLNLELVGPPANLQRQLHINVDVTHDTESSYSVQGWFFPGSDGRGNTAASDPVLVVNGEPIKGERDNRGSWMFLWESSPTARTNQPQVVELLIPQDNGPPDQERRVSIPIPVSTDPPEVRLTSGEDLILHVTAGPGGPAFEGETVIWELRVGAACGDSASPATRIQGRLRYPSELRVPWAWIDSITSPIDVCFQSFSRHQAVGAPYAVDIFSGLRVGWRVTVN